MMVTVTTTGTTLTPTQLQYMALFHIQVQMAADVLRAD